MWSKKSSCSHSLTHRKIFAVAEHLGESGLQSRLAVLLHVPSVQSGVGGLVYVVVVFCNFLCFGWLCLDLCCFLLLLLLLVKCGGGACKV